MDKPTFEKHKKIFLERVINQEFIEESHEGITMNNYLNVVIDCLADEYVTGLSIMSFDEGDLIFSFNPEVTAIGHHYLNSN